MSATRALTPSHYAVTKRTSSAGLGTLSTKLAENLRDEIKTLHSGVAVHSEEWTAMAAVVSRVATISEMERELSAESAPEASLWEGEEMALRFVMDEGKSKVVLVLLIEAKEWLLEWRRESGITAAAAVEVEVEESVRAAERFEESVGTIARNMLSHLVCLQTVDVTRIVVHCVHVMEAARGRDGEGCCGAGLEKRQETALMHYVCAIARNVDELGDARIMEIVRKHRLIEALVRHIDAHREALGREHLLLGIEALSHFLDTEAFRTDNAEFLAEEEDVARIAAWDDAFLRDVSRADRELRKRLRGVLDFSLKCQRRMRK
jgi:hypothetical protein